MVEMEDFIVTMFEVVAGDLNDGFVQRTSFEVRLVGGVTDYRYDIIRY